MILRRATAEPINGRGAGRAEVGMWLVRITSCSRLKSCNVNKLPVFMSAEEFKSTPRNHPLY